MSHPLRCARSPCPCGVGRRTYSAGRTLAGPKGRVNGEDPLLNTHATDPKHSAPRLLAIGGLSGTGKSTLARGLLGCLPGAVLLRSDVERKLLFSVAETTRLGADGYTADATRRVYLTLAEKAAAALAAGRTVIVDAVFARENEREAIEAVAASAHVPFVGLWLEATAAVQIARVEARTGDASDATADVVARQATYDLGHLAWHHIDASHGPDQTLADARAVLGL